VEFRTDTLFGFEVPVSAPDVDSKLLVPRPTSRAPNEYDRKARELARMFRDNFEKRFAADASNIAIAGPRV